MAAVDVRRRGRVVVFPAAAREPHYIINRLGNFIITTCPLFIFRLLRQRRRRFITSRELAELLFHPPVRLLPRTYINITVFKCVCVCVCVCVYVCARLCANNASFQRVYIYTHTKIRTRVRLLYAYMIYTYKRE